MKAKNSFINLLVVLVCLLCLTMTTAAQKRRKTTTRKTTKAAVTKTDTTNAAKEAANAEFRAGAEKVSAQIKNTTRFIYLLGSIAQGIEDVDRAVKAKKASPATAEQNEKNKQGVITTLQNLRAGLVALENDFQASPTLRLYLAHIQGISDVSAIAEQQAKAGQLTESGKTLLQVIDRLSDTVAALP